MSKSQSMLNNLKSITGNRYGVDKAINYIKTIKLKTRKSEKELLEQMVIYSFNNMPEYASARTKSIAAAAASEHKAKLCLSHLRTVTGRTEQSILVSMVIYACENDPSLQFQPQDNTNTVEQ